jgi:RHS repeat-associated protein
VPRVLLTYSYDGLGNRIKLLDNFTQQGNISYGYDGDHHLTGMSMTAGTNQGPQVTFHYDSNNNIDSLTRFLSGPNQIQSTFHYDAYGRQDIITHAGATTLATYTYTYDEDSRVTGFQGPTDSVTYSYDGNNELLTVNGTRAETYSYDHNGNRNMTGYVTGTGNQMTADGTYTYSYDNEGNMLTKSGGGLLVTYTWDYRNRLINVQSTGGTPQNVTFTYDMFGHRIVKAPQGGTQIATVYDGENPYADFNNGATTPTYRYLYGNATDLLFARYDGTSVNASTDWYLTDQLGSVRQVVETDGTVLATISYDSFGNILSGSFDRFGFAGQQYDSETLLYYDRARYYSPAVGRFVSQDPVGLAGGDVNLYRYVYNSPTNGTDPTGLDGSSTQLLGTTPSPYPAPDEGRDFESTGADFGPRSSAPTGIDWAFPTPLPPYSGPSIGPPSKDPQIQWINEATDPEERERRLRNIKMERAGYSPWYISLEWLGAHGGLELLTGALAPWGAPSTTRPAQVTINRQAGLEFQRQVTTAASAETVGPMRGTTLAGLAYRTIPDGIMTTWYRYSS